MSEKEKPPADEKKKKCPICGEKSTGKRCKCGHYFRPSD